jgi:hypothetical protein
MRPKSLSVRFMLSAAPAGDSNEPQRSQDCNNTGENMPSQLEQLVAALLAVGGKNARKSGPVSQFSLRNSLHASVG